MVRYFLVTEQMTWLLVNNPHRQIIEQFCRHAHDIFTNRWRNRIWEKPCGKQRKQIQNWVNYPGHQCLPRKTLPSVVTKKSVHEMNQQMIKAKKKKNALGKKYWKDSVLCYGVFRSLLIFFWYRFSPISVSFFYNLKKINTKTTKVLVF